MNVVEDLSAIVEVIRTCFETRDFDPMVELFAEDGVYETPYALENSRSEGIDAIRKRFAQVSASEWNKAVKIDQVKAIQTSASDGKTVFAEFFITGHTRANNTHFDFPSSVALITVRNGKIEYYKDFPNVEGIRKAAGLN